MYLKLKGIEINKYPNAMRIAAAYLFLFVRPVKKYKVVGKRSLLTIRPPIEPSILYNVL